MIRKDQTELIGTWKQDGVIQTGNSFIVITSYKKEVISLKIFY